MSRPSLPVAFTLRELRLVWRAFARQRRLVSATAETVRVVRRCA